MVKKEYSSKKLYRFKLQGYDFAPFQVISDGVYLYEIRPEEKAYRTFSFPDSIVVPLINRTSTLPYNHIYFEIDYLHSIINSARSVNLVEEDNSWKISIDVSETLDEGSILVANIDISVSKHTFFIEKIERHSELNHLKSTYSWEYSDIKLNQISNLDIATLVTNLNQYESISEEAEETNVKQSKATTLTYAPNITGINQYDSAISLYDYKEKYVLIDFWETWCLYCITAFPKLDELAMKYSDENFTILGVTKENEKIVRDLVVQNNFKYPNIFTNQDVDSDYNLFGRPQYILVAPGGKIYLNQSSDINHVISTLKDVFGY
jgi:thiol-disulfide isomerase/thioredoxin